ncbi:hypothetical protein NUU61_006815, partial [Penicillium alfredii]
ATATPQGPTAFARHIKPASHPQPRLSNSHFTLIVHHAIQSTILQIPLDTHRRSKRRLRRAERALRETNTAKKKKKIHRTTDNHTSAVAQFLAHLVGLDESPVLEMLIRGLCLGLNVLCNVIMWALFTRALTAGPSTTKVSITNTASNFLMTALLGMVVFQEAVGGLWWIGAAMMGAGCILVGMREGA